MAGALLALVGPSVVGHTRAYTPSPLLVADRRPARHGGRDLAGRAGRAGPLAARAGRPRGAGCDDARPLLHPGRGHPRRGRGQRHAPGLADGRLVGRPRRDGVRPAAAGEDRDRAAVAAIGGWNRWRTLPGVRAASGFGDRERAASAVARAVRVEAVLLVVLLGVTGFLVSQSPRPAPVTVASGSTGVGAATAGELRVLAALDPRRTGSNSLLVQVQDAAGEPTTRPPTPSSRCAPRASTSARSRCARSAPARIAARSSCRARATWEVQVSIRLSRFDNPVTTVRLTVRHGELHGHGVQEAVDADLREEPVVAGLGDVGVEGQLRPVLGEVGGSRAGAGAPSRRSRCGSRSRGRRRRGRCRGSPGRPGRRARRGAAARRGRWSVRGTPHADDVVARDRVAGSPGGSASGRPENDVVAVAARVARDELGDPR